MRTLRTRLATLWRWVRQLSGDDAFERYRAHQRACHPGAQSMGRAEFYLHEQRRKWGGVNRCC